MLTQLVVFVALLKFGESQTQCVKDVRSLSEQLKTGLRDVENSTVTAQRELQSFIREEVESVVRSEVQSIVQSEVQSIVRSEVRSIVRSEVRSIVRSEVRSIQSDIQSMAQALSPGTIANPVLSCTNLRQGSPSGYYWIQSNNSHPARQYCDMTRSCCNTTGGWMRVANLDMRDSNQQCPSGFRYVSAPQRSCNATAAPGCTSVIYPVHGVEYSRVCGRVIGYQTGSADAFHAYLRKGQTTIDGYYVDGVSLTHGSPRKHIWTFATAGDESRSDVSTCPCIRPDLSYTPPVPPFVGNDYFCETGSQNPYMYYRFYHEDPLWDGQGCGSRSTCCSFNNPPWFCKRLSQPTTDDIELRLCKNENYDNEDVSLEQIQLYVQ